jgi:hypothetical protein
MMELKAGAAAISITPREPHFLFGYPFVERMSTGTQDELLSSALYLSDGKTLVGRFRIHLFSELVSDSREEKSM